MISWPILVDLTLYLNVMEHLHVSVLLIWPYLFTFATGRRLLKLLVQRNASLNIFYYFYSYQLAATNKSSSIIVYFMFTQSSIIFSFSWSWTVGCLRKIESKVVIMFCFLIWPPVTQPIFKWKVSVTRMTQFLYQTILIQCVLISKSWVWAE